MSEDVRLYCFSHTAGSSLPGISRISGLAYDTVVNIVQAASEKAQIVHNAEVQAVDTDAIGETLNLVIRRKKHFITACPKN